MYNIKDIYWIPVVTSKGMFSSEVAINLKLTNGNVVSFFADKTLIREDRGQSQLKVCLVSKKKNSSLVLLPSETFETSSRWVEVPHNS